MGETKLFNKEAAPTNDRSSWNDRLNKNAATTSVHRVVGNWDDPARVCMV